MSALLHLRKASWLNIGREGKKPYLIKGGKICTEPPPWHQTPFHACMAQSSPVLGLPTSCARGFPGGNCRCSCKPSEPALPCRQLPLPPGPAVPALLLTARNIAGVGVQLQDWKPHTRAAPSLFSDPKGGMSKVIYCYTRHFLTLATWPRQGEETSPEDQPREENCTGYSEFLVLVTTADVGGVLSLCPSCWERWGWTLGSRAPMGHGHFSGRVEMDVVWGSCCGVRGCVPVPGDADPADGGSWAKLESANPAHGALHARAWNYSWQMELPAIVPWGAGHLTLFPISVRGLYSPDTPRGDVLQKSWYRVSFHHHLNIHRKGK